ncbi:MAG TPA: histidine kinase [Bacteroidales bacterium]|nr:histidine kinase [Bacteroidales bacterium]
MKDIFAGKKIKVLLHILVWVIILGLPLVILKQYQVGNEFLWFYYSINILSGLIFYLNYLILVPLFYFRKKRKAYFLSVLLTLVFFYFVSSYSGALVFRYVTTRYNHDYNTEEMRRQRPPRGERVEEPKPPEPGSLPFRRPFRSMHLVNYLSSSFFLMFLSLGLRALEKQGEIEKVQRELEKEKLNSELAFLKNQISPHFFFNTLNNIYSLIGINAEDSQKAVLKLSKLMRYLLYESENGNTMLSNEIDFMKNYIDLMKLRMNDKVSLKIDFPGEYTDVSIPPLLFIPFIENAFKHGISGRGKSFIDVRLSSAPGILVFTCSNSIALKGSEDKQPGIGLENVKKRLALLFPGKHDLDIEKQNETFNVVLKIQLS